ncbi:MAG: hypothetical protein KatS3mg080_0751 [Anoxybacillus sp.]|nr:MAG: hypothetical protein KatS3mg080_0751 [Anoxybacillus sp.]
MMERISKLQQKLKDANGSWAFITSTANVFYFSGFYSNPHERLLAVVIFPNDETVFSSVQKWMPIKLDKPVGHIRSSAMMMCIILGICCAMS